MTLGAKLGASILLAMAATSASAAEAVRWQTIVGNMIAGTSANNGGAGDNPVAGISSGNLPWTTLGGSARIDLFTGTGAFNVQGLVLNGGNATGTVGPINSVVGTLVCNAGDATNQAIVDTPATPLDQQGNAQLHFRISVPAPCNNPLFLLRIPQFGLRWIATAAVPVTFQDF